MPVPQSKASPSHKSIYTSHVHLRPWDGMNDLLQYEHDYRIQTKTRHRTPIVRTMSITNVEESAKNKHPTRLTNLRLKRSVHKGRSSASIRRQEIESSVADADICYESSDSADDISGCCHGGVCSDLQRVLKPLIEAQTKNTVELTKLQTQLAQLQTQMAHMQRAMYSQKSGESRSSGLTVRDMFIIAMLLAWQLVVVWLVK